VIPRIRGVTAKPGGANGGGDELYEKMADEDGNVGGAYWDLERDGEGRPRPGGSFPGIEDCARVARTMDEMREEARTYRGVLEQMERGQV
jgi:bis(5'-adenosyl)-triphosphatase